MIKEFKNENGETTLTYWDGTEWKGKSIDEETRAFIAEYTRRHPGRGNTPQYDNIYGELFAIRYIAHLTKTSARIDIKKVIDPIEGKDFICFDILGGNGNVEIKTIKPFLTQNNNPYSAPDTGGSIPFEIFHRWIPDAYDRMYAGWLLSAYNCIEYNKIKEDHGRAERAETPGLYVYVLMGYTHRPYACIVFENIFDLLTRLYEICPDAEGWGIPDPATLRPASDRAYWDRFDARYHYDRRSGGMIQNCWNVPFRSLSRLATVTMINEIDLEKELENATYKCSMDTVERRYKNLQFVADRDGRNEPFDPDAWTEEENEWIKTLEDNGAKVSKRNYISLGNAEFEMLQQGIMIGKNGGHIRLEVMDNGEEGLTSVDNTLQVDEER